jgi:hypothetical protein
VPDTLPAGVPALEPLGADTPGTGPRRVEDVVAA